MVSKAKNKNIQDSNNKKLALGCITKLRKNASLLEIFTFDKISNYVEPVRKGVPKGDPIGFYKPKFMASIFTLWDLSLQEIAEIVGTSYGNMRIWKNQDQFYEMVEVHHMEFVYLLINSAKNIKDEFYNKYSDCLGCKTKEKPEIKTYILMKECDLHNESILEELEMELFYSYMIDIEGINQRQTTFERFLDNPIIYYLITGENILHKRSDIGGNFLDYMLSLLLDFLQKEEITKNDKESMISKISIFKDVLVV